MVQRVAQLARVDCTARVPIEELERLADFVGNVAITTPLKLE